MEYETYRSVLFGNAFGLFFCVLLVVYLLPNRLLAELFEKQFDVVRSNKEQWIVNFYGVEINFLASWRFRLSLIWQFAGTTWTILLLLNNGWLFQARDLSEHEMCPIHAIDCFTYESMISNARIPCNPGEPLSSWNSSSFLCFVWVYKEVRAVDILNEIGITSSVFSFSCYGFKWLCCLSRKRFGLALIILLLIASLTSTILSFIGSIRISILGLLLLADSCALLINVTQLFQYTYRHQRKVLLSK